MPDFLQSTFADQAVISPYDVTIRLLTALALGWAVAWIYNQHCRHKEINSTFPATLVLLAVLIAIVTQVIGNNVARAFSLVGALSIVRFRTVVRDTQDTAYVIFAVVVGMAVGSQNLWVACIGLGVIGLAAYLLKQKSGQQQEAALAFLLSLRVDSTRDLESLLTGTLDAHLPRRELMSIGTAKEGLSLDLTYETWLGSAGALNPLVSALKQIEGVQRVNFRRRGFDNN